MPKVRIKTANQALASIASGKYRGKAVLVGETGHKYVMPFAPREVEHDGFARQWGQTARPGRKPLLEEAGPSLRTMSFKFVVARRDGRSIEADLGRLQFMSEIGQRVYWRYGRRERGWYRITTCTVNSVYRAPVTNDITHATVSMTLTEAIDVKLQLGPLSGGAKSRNPKSPGRTKPKTRSYVVKRGDTLWEISQRFLGDPYRWKEIAKRNGVNDPRKLQIGHRLTLPAR